jgi:hypothetical protein
MKSRSIGMAGAALLAGAMWSQASYASTFTIDVWTDEPTDSMSANSAHVPGTTPTFVYDFSTTTGALELFIPGGGTDTVAAFLATEPAGDGTMSCVSCTGASDPVIGDLQNTFFKITGTTLALNGESYTITHDDGASLYIDGIKVIQKGAPTPSSISSGTYSGPTGPESFELVYGENNGLPAQLVATLPVPGATSTTPLPATLPLLATGLGFLGFLGRRKRNVTSAFAA